MEFGEVDGHDGDSFGFLIFMYSAGGGRIGGYKKPAGERHCGMLSLAGWVRWKAWFNYCFSFFLTSNYTLHLSNYLKQSQ